jgi:hypothetical protein
VIFSTACYLLFSSHTSCFTNSNNINEEWRLCNSSLCNFLHPSVTSVFLCPDTQFSILFSNTLNRCSSLRVRSQASRPYNTQFPLNFNGLFAVVDSVHKTVISKNSLMQAASNRKMAVFWDAAPCSLLEIDRRFRSAYCLHHQCVEL